tara:strand:+ start:1319 stop:2428 length:1110 start_codon:yes stop_codon:yes gene_type:complete
LEHNLSVKKMSDLRLQNQGYRRDQNLKENPADGDVWSNLYNAGVDRDISVIRNNLRNISTIGFSSINEGFFEYGNDSEFVYTNDDIVSFSGTVSFGSTTGIAATDAPAFVEQPPGSGIFNANYYYVCNSDARSKFKLSIRPSGDPLGVSTLNIGSNPTAVDTPSGPAGTATTFTINRTDPVSFGNIVNYIKPEKQDEEFNFFVGDDDNIDNAFDNISSNAETAEYYVETKYKSNDSTETTKQLKVEGSMVVNDPTGYNNNQSSVDNNVSGIFIGDTRAFSTDNNPWTETGTAGDADAELKTESHQVSMGSLDFGGQAANQGEVIISGIGTVTLGTASPITDPTDSTIGWTHKVPVVINDETYFLLLKDS